LSRRPPVSRHRYTLYGLEVEAAPPLPGLVPNAVRAIPDVRLRALPRRAASSAPEPGPLWYRGNHASPDEDPTLTIHRRPGGGFALCYADGTEVRVNAAGTRLACTWSEPLTLDDAATYLLGAACGFVLRLRGVTCLHASAIAIGDGAILVCGPGGTGKSTTAAALAARGHPVLTDDIAALDPGPAGVTVRPGYPHVRLWPDAVRALYGPSAELPRLTPTWDKRRLDLSAGGFHPRPLPVRAVYVLAGREDADAPRLEPIPPGEAVLSLISNTYMGYLPDLAASGRDLALYGRLVRQVPVFLAVPHADPARLGVLCDLLEADALAREGDANG
jgi:hypothetical protein